MSPDPGQKRTDFCIGDRDGTTCGKEFLDFIVGLLGELGYSVAVNKPFKGVEVVRRHGDPSLNTHSLQIEIGRGLFLDEKTNRPSSGFRKLSADLTRFAASVAIYARGKIGAGTASPM